MIKATCPCGGTYESDTNYYESDRQNTIDWLTLHQECVHIRVVEHQMTAKKTAVMKLDWKSGFQFIDSDQYGFRPAGNTVCKSCGYVQPVEAPSVHASDCPNTGIDHTFPGEN